MLAVAQQIRRDVCSGKPDPLDPAFEAGEQEVLVLANRAAINSAELVLVMFGLGLAGGVVLEIVGVENRVAEVVENVAMPLVISRLERGVDHAAAETAERRVVGVGHHLEFLHRLDIGRDMPSAAAGTDRRAIEQEQILSGARAINLVRSMLRPTRACPRSRWAEVSCVKITPGVKAISM